MNKFLTVLFVSISAVCMGSGVVYDGFASSNYTAGTLQNQNPSVAGFEDAWNTGNNIFAGGTNYALTYSGLATEDSGGAYSASAGNRAVRNLSEPLTGTNVYYLSCLMKNEAIHADTNNYRCLELWSYGNRNLQIGANRDISSDGTQWGIRAVDSSTYRTSSVPALSGETVLAVVRITFSTDSGGDAVRFWINPLDLSSEANSTNYIETSGFNFINNAIDRMSFASFGGTAVGQWDEFRIGSTWESAVPFPQAPTYSVTYQGNNNTAGVPPVDNLLYEQGETVTVLANTGSLERAGYTFIDWDTASDGQGTRYAAGDTFLMATSSVSLYATWARLPQPPNTYTVTYHGNGNTGGLPPEDIQYYPAGSTVTVAHAATLSRIGWSFNGWNTETNGSGIMYQPDETFTIGNVDTDLYASWVLNPSTGRAVRVFVLAGQSNMRGSGTVRQAPDEWRPLEDVFFDETTPNDPTSYSADWERLGLDVDHMGPEMGFAATLRDAYTNEQIAIVKVSQSATGITYWDAPGDLGYDTLMDRIDVVTDRLNTQAAANEIPSWSFGGFLWMQGENEADSIESVALAYESDFETVASRIRNKTANTNLPVVLARISIQLDPAAGGPVNQPQLDYVRAGQVSWATNDAYGAWVNTDDLSQVDLWHFGSYGQITLGKRFAEAWFSIAETRPTLTLRRANGQDARSSASSVQYDATFSAAVTGFTSDDVEVLGDTDPAEISVQEIAPLDGTTYRITVSGMENPGVVDIKVRAAVAQAGGLDNLPGIAEETAVLYTPHPAVVDLLVYNPFDSESRPLSRMQSGIGWNGAGWEVQNEVSNSYLSSTALPLSYTNLCKSPGYGTGGDNYQSSARALDLDKLLAEYVSVRGAGAIDVPGTTLWLSYLIRPGNAGTYQRFALLSGTGATYSDAYNTIKIDQNGGFWRLTAMNGTETVDTGVPVQANTNYLMVVRVTIGGDASASSGHLWINPEAGFLGGADLDLATATSSITLTNANFKFGRIHWYPGGGSGDGAIDEIRIGTSFASVTPVATATGDPSDLDGDHLPDSWETLHFGGTGLVSGNESASNGVNTVMECYIAGLDPNDLYDTFTVESTNPASPNMVIQWTPVAGRVVNIYTSTNLVTGHFEPLYGPIEWPQASYTADFQNVEAPRYIQVEILME